METKTVKQFKEETYYDVIKNIMDSNNGYITSRMITELGIHRMFLKKMLERKEIVKVTSGVYSYSNVKTDNLYVLQQRYPKIIYTGVTGLIIHGFIKDNNYKYNLSVPYNYHVQDLEDNYNVLKSDTNNYELGITQATSKLNHYIKVYNIERCICDIIKHNKLYNNEIIKDILLKYDKKCQNTKLLNKYIKDLKIEKKLSKILSSINLKLSNGVWDGYNNKKGNTKI